MTINTNTLVSIIDPSQNFFKVARLVAEHGTAVILKNNVLRYLIIDFVKAKDDAIVFDRNLMDFSKRFSVRPFGSVMSIQAKLHVLWTSRPQQFLRMILKDKK